MSTITLRSVKGSPLTNNEVDTNFSNLNSDKLETSAYTASDVLSKLLTVDGTGSGLDADLLDGLNAASTNTVSTIVSRDSSGNFAAGTITATAFSGPIDGTIGATTPNTGKFTTNLIGSNANFTDFPNAQLVSAQANTGHSHTYNMALVGEATAHISTTTQWGVGVYGRGNTNVATRSAGLLGDGGVTNSSDTGSAVGVRGYATDTHAGGSNVGLRGEASGGATNYALAMTAGDILSETAQSWLLLDNNASALSIDATGKTGILKIITTDAGEGVTMSGTLGVTGATTITGALAANGGITVDSTNFSVNGTTGAVSTASTLGVTGVSTLTGGATIQGLTAGKGAQALTDNTAFGVNALAAVTIAGTATTCTAIGYYACAGTTTAASNTGVGANALFSATTGDSNTALGDSALYFNINGTQNTAVGLLALRTNSSGNYNTAIGVNALRLNDTGSNNTAIGWRAGWGNNALGNVSGTGNVYIGDNTRGAGTGETNTIVIGSGIVGQGSNYLTFGSTGNLVYNQFTVDATWARTSDIRLKQDIKEDSLGLAFINDLRTVTYRWKPSNEVPTELVDNYSETNVKDTETVMHGLIAQEVKSALDKAGVDTFGGWGSQRDGTQTLSREMFVIPLIKAVQELTAELDKVKEQLKQLNK